MRQRETCPKTGRLCAAGCQTDTNLTGYCYEKEIAGDYKNPALVERARIVAWLRGGWDSHIPSEVLNETERGLAAVMRALANTIERGEHDQPSGGPG